ncbi:hypothetical protein, partial [Streptomyces fungicidicus]
MPSMMERIKQFARSPQGRRTAEQVRRAAADPRRRAQAPRRRGPVRGGHRCAPPHTLPCGPA